jgi:hypothetical protein
MSSTNTSIGPAANQGGNDSPGNADGCGNKTLGANVDQQHQPPAGADLAKEARAAKDAYPDGPNVAPSAKELDAARGQLPKEP